MATHFNIYCGGRWPLPPTFEIEMKIAMPRLTTPTSHCGNKAFQKSFPKTSRNHILKSWKATIKSFIIDPNGALDATQGHLGSPTASNGDVLDPHGRPMAPRTRKVAKTMKFGFHFATPNAKSCENLKFGLHFATPNATQNHKKHKTNAEKNEDVFT